MNRLLKRQIGRYFGKNFDSSSFSKEILELLEDVSESYDELYEEKKFLEHTVGINSQDLEQANKKILQQNTRLKGMVDKAADENEEMVHLLKQYKEAIDVSLIVSITDVSGNIKYVNENFCKISGYTKDELVGKKHNIVRHPDNSKELFREIWTTILNKQVWQGIFPNLAKDGSTYYVSATIFPLVNIYGEIVEFMALREDVTKTIEYQNELQSQKHRVTEILDNQESIIVLFDRRDGIIEANKKFYETFDFESLSDFRSHHHCVCELFEEKEGFLKRSHQDRHWFSPIILEPEKVHLASIQKRVYSVKIAIFEMDSKETLLANFTDITEIEEARIKSKEAEKEKSYFLANMSHEIRTPMNAILGFSQLLSRTQLDPRQNKFVELIKNSSTTLLDIINDILDFSKLESGMSDVELVNINPFMEFEETFMILSQKAKEKQLSYMIKIDHNLEECIAIDSFHIKQILMNLIGNAIKFTREGGTVDIRIEKHISVGEKKIRFSVQDTGIGIPKDRQEKIFEPFSQADSSTTRQFGGTGLGLSISNSLAAIMGSKLQLDSKEGQGSKFYFDLKYESCVGENTLKAHLEQFNVYLCELSGSLFSSIAIQLSAYDIPFKTITKFNNEIDFDNSIIISTNESATKNFKNAKILLLSKGSSDSADSRQHSVEMFEEFPSIIYNELMRLKLIKADIRSSGRAKNLDLKILVAEDYEINRILISELLDQFSIEYEFAFNGQEAVEKVKKSSYDLILMDINMPIMNGMDATKIIVNELKIKTPIVALTANALEGDKEMFLSFGMVDYLSKPINIKAFEELLIKFNTSLTQKNHENDLSKATEKTLLTQKNRETDKTFDVQVSLALAAKNMNFPQVIINKIFDAYVESLDGIEINIQNGIETNSFEIIQINSHNLKSGADSLCFHHLGKLAQELETNAKEKNISFDYSGTFEEVRFYLQKIKSKQ